MLNRKKAISRSIPDLFIKCKLKYFVSFNELLRNNFSSQNISQDYTNAICHLLIFPQKWCPWEKGHKGGTCQVINVKCFCDKSSVQI